MLKSLLRGALALALIAAVVPVSAQQMWKWSTTAATNATADSAINWATGMAPSAVSPSSRAMMAAVARYRNDVAGAITSTGTASAYAVTSNSSVSATPPDGYQISFIPHATNAANATLAVDGGTAFAIQSAIGISNITAGVLVQGTPYTAVFKASANVWGIHGYFGNPAGVPVGTVLTYAGASAPTANFALAYGQAISRTTYASLFALVGTIYGIGDGATTFNLPDLRGRFIAGLDNMGGSAANRITVAGGNYDGTVNGGTGGAQNHTLTTAELPTFTPSGSISTFTPSGSVSTFTPSGSVSTFTPSGSVSAITPSGTVSAPTITINSGTNIFQQGGGGAANLTHGGGVDSVVTITATSSAPTFTGTLVTPTFTGNLVSPTFTGNLISPTFTGNLVSPTFTGNAVGSGNAHSILPPAISLPMIIRIL